MFNDVKDADLPTLNSVEGAWHPPLLVLNADVLTETLNDPIIDWKEGDITRKVSKAGEKRQQKCYRRSEATTACLNPR